jgi:hypothetical protein
MDEFGEQRQPIKIYCRTCEAIINLGASCPSCPRPSLLAAWLSFFFLSQEMMRRLAACGVALLTLAACLYLLQIRTRHFSSGVVMGSLGAQLLAALMFVPIGFAVMFNTRTVFRVSFALMVALVATAIALLILDEVLVRLSK